MSYLAEPPEVLSAAEIRQLSEELATDAFYLQDKHVLAWLEAQDDLRERYVSYAMQRATYWDLARERLLGYRSDE
ncbi:MAG TPA: hypothetical protein VJ323_08165 [Bryobacteraceae bacterium]|jgi:hypothetical protein|nr:hypothetical protein [Bryobacteraceae bacterium]